MILSPFIQAAAAAALKAKLEDDARLREIALQKKRDDELKAAQEAKAKLAEEARQRELALRAKKEADELQRKKEIEEVNVYTSSFFALHLNGCNILQTD